VITIWASPYLGSTLSYMTPVMFLQNWMTAQQKEKQVAWTSLVGRRKTEGGQLNSHCVNHYRKGNTLGRAKNEQMEHEDKIYQAIGLCIEIGVIRECVVHEGTYIDSMEYSDPEELTAKILEENPDALGLFENQNEMLECVRDAMASAGEECGSCAKNRDS